MLGFFNLFGRSREQQRLDLALREAGVHPGTVDEAVKLTVLRLLRERRGDPDYESLLVACGGLLSYCLIGPEEFLAANGQDATAAMERRLALALEAPEGLDARVILLTLHSGAAHPAVAGRFDWDAEEDA